MFLDTVLPQAFGKKKAQKDLTLGSFLSKILNSSVEG